MITPGFRTLRTALLVCLLILAGATSTTAANLFVRQGATGSGNGSDWNNAFPQVPTTLVRGNTYYIADGNYLGLNFDDPVSGSTFIIIKKAIESDHGTDVGWDPSFGDGQAIFSAHLWFRSSFWILDGQVRNNDGRSGHGFKVSNAGGSDPVAALRIGDFGLAVSDITVQFVEVEGTSSIDDTFNDAGIRLLGNLTTNILISRCYIHDVGQDLMLIRGADNVTVEHSIMAYNDSSPTAHGQGISASENMNNFVVRHNVFEDIEGTSYIATPGVNKTGAGASSNWYIHGNVFWFNCANPRNRGGVGQGPIGVINNMELNGDFFIFNNTFINFRDSTCRNGGNTNPQIAVSSSIIGGDFRVQNNLWYFCDAVSPLGMADTWSHNAYYDTPATNDLDVNKEIRIGVDPFIDWFRADFRLAIGNNAGAPLTTPFDSDRSGAARGVDMVWDRGMFEFDNTKVGPARSVRVIP